MSSGQLITLALGKLSLRISFIDIKNITGYRMFVLALLLRERRSQCFLGHLRNLLLSDMAAY